MYNKLLVLFLILFFSFALAAEAAIKSKKDVEAEANDPTTWYNPKPAEGDIELPMPNGLKMVLRAVAVPYQPKLGFFSDESFNMGLINADKDRGYYEGEITGYVSAPFLLENLPQAWADKVPVDSNKKDAFTYYFIGKYELSNAQWDAVMGEKSGNRGNLPKTNISWYDMQNFLHKYNQWLLSQPGIELPKIDGLPAYLRLPTETEWEFAARGGKNVPSAKAAQNDFVKVSDDSNVSDYAIFNQATPMPIGSRRPNPLGIHDLAGNASELVRDGFRFTFTDHYGAQRMPRLHGSEGGFISKGGNYHSGSETEVYPGKRVETRMFKEEGEAFVPYKSNELGARFVLSSINVPGDHRGKDINDDWNRLSSVQPLGNEKASRKSAETRRQQPESSTETVVQIDMNGDILEELNKIYNATDSQSVKSNLEQFRNLVKDVNQSFNRERDANLISSIRSTIYMADSLANIAFRCYQVKNALEQARLIKGFTPQMEKNFIESLNNHFKNLETSTNIYKINVRDLARYDDDDLDSKIAHLRQEYSGNDVLNTNFRKNLDNFKEHLDIAKTKGFRGLPNSKVWEDIIPDGQMRNTVFELANTGTPRVKKWQ